MNNKQHYTVRQLAHMAGVTPRTLHYYDQIGLLSPQRNPDNDYRLYDRQSVLRLQQILFMRELGLSLEQIGRVLDSPDYALLPALEQHRQALQERQQRLARLIGTVERTIAHMKGETDMPTEELFSGFSEEQQKEYEAEIEQRYGDKYLKESQRRWGSYSEEKKRQIMAEGEAIYRDLAVAIPLGPTSPQAQATVARWHQHLRYFYEPTVEILRGLGNGYADDPAFANRFAKLHPDLPEFLREAIAHYCSVLKE